MLTLRAVYGVSEPKVAARSRVYRITSIKEDEDSGLHRYTTIVYGGSQPARSQISVGSFQPDTQCRVTCTCKYFQMNCYVPLVMQGSTPRIYANQLLPLKRNPKLKPGLCPHLYLLASLLLSQWERAKAIQAQEDQEAADRQPVDDAQRWSWLNPANVAVTQAAVADDFGLTPTEMATGVATEASDS